jgi:hypothetical protein
MPVPSLATSWACSRCPEAVFWGKLGDQYPERKRKDESDILIEELQKSSPEPNDFADVGVAPLIDIIYQMSKAVVDGAARDTLRLLAQVIAGLNRNKALDHDKFRKWANTLEQLTRDELMLVGKTRRSTSSGSCASSE